MFLMSCRRGSVFPAAALVEEMLGVMSCPRASLLQCKLSSYIFYFCTPETGRCGYVLLYVLCFSFHGECYVLFFYTCLGDVVLCSGMLYVFRVSVGMGTAASFCCTRGLRYECRCRHSNYISFFRSSPHAHLALPHSPATD